MCVEIIRYKVYNHERRRILEKCRFIRRVGCFEPVIAYFCGPTGMIPCQFLMVQGQVHEVEGWCAPWCKKRYELLDPRNFKCRTPTVYMREQKRVANIAREFGQEAGSRSRWSQRTAVEMVGARYGYGAKMERDYEDPAAAPCDVKADGPSEPPIASDSQEGKVNQGTDEETTRPQRVPLVWPFRGHPNREQMTPALDFGSQPTPNHPQQKKERDANRPGRGHRSSRDFAKTRSVCSDSTLAGSSRRESFRRPVGEMSLGGNGSGSSKRSPVTRSSLSEIYRRMELSEEPDTENAQKRGKKDKKSKKVEKKKPKASKVSI